MIVQAVQFGDGGWIGRRADADALVRPGTNGEVFMKIVNAAPQGGANGVTTMAVFAADVQALLPDAIVCSGDGGEHRFEVQRFSAVHCQQTACKVVQRRDGVNAQGTWGDPFLSRTGGCPQQPATGVTSHSGWAADSDHRWPTRPGEWPPRWRPRKTL